MNSFKHPALGYYFMMSIKSKECSAHLDMYELAYKDRNPCPFLTKLFYKGERNAVQTFHTKRDSLMLDIMKQNYFIQETEENEGNYADSEEISVLQNPYSKHLFSLMT